MFKFGEQLQVGKRFGSRYMLELILVSTHLDLHGKLSQIYNIMV